MTMNTNEHHKVAHSNRKNDGKRLDFRAPHFHFQTMIRWSRMLSGVKQSSCKCFRAFEGQILVRYTLNNLVGSANPPADFNPQISTFFNNDYRLQFQRSIDKDLKGLIAGPCWASSASTFLSQLFGFSHGKGNVTRYREAVFKTCSVATCTMWHNVAQWSSQKMSSSFWNVVKLYGFQSQCLGAGCLLEFSSWRWPPCPHHEEHTRPPSSWTVAFYGNSSTFFCGLGIWCAVMKKLCTVPEAERTTEQVPSWSLLYRGICSSTGWFITILAHS